MFSFFKKKPASGAPAAAPDTPPAADAGAARAPADADSPASERERGAFGWLNADVGELLFGKRAADVGEPQASPPSPASIAADGESVVERAGWLVKLKSGLQRTGSTIASAFVAAEINDELYEDL